MLAHTSNRTVSSALAQHVSDENASKPAQVGRSIRVVRGVAVRSSLFHLLHDRLDCTPDNFSLLLGGPELDTPTNTDVYLSGATGALQLCGEYATETGAQI